MFGFSRLDYLEERFRLINRYGPEGIDPKKMLGQIDEIPSYTDVVKRLAALEAKNKMLEEVFNELFPGDYRANGKVLEGYKSRITALEEQVKVLSVLVDLALSGRDIVLKVNSEGRVTSVENRPKSGLIMTKDSVEFTEDLGKKPAEGALG